LLAPPVVLLYCIPGAVRPACLGCSLSPTSLPCTAFSRRFPCVVCVPCLTRAFNPPNRSACLQCFGAQDCGPSPAHVVQAKDNPRRPAVACASQAEQRACREWCGCRRQRFRPRRPSREMEEERGGLQPERTRAQRQTRTSLRGRLGQVLHVPASAQMREHRGTRRRGRREEKGRTSRRGG